MTKIIHKTILIFIILSFISAFYIVREHINNTVLPKKEKLLLSKINEEIKLLKESFNDKLFIDAQQSSSYLIHMYKDKLEAETIENLELLNAKSTAQIAMLSKNNIDIDNALKGLEKLQNSLFVSIKIEALISMAECTMAYPEINTIVLNNAIKYLKEALIFTEQKEIINNYLSSFLAMTLLEKFSIERSTNLKKEAIQILNKNITLNKNKPNINELADSRINLAIAHVKIASIHQKRINLNKASIIMEDVQKAITRQHNPIKNARIMRIIGDIYYLRSKQHKLATEAGPRYIQDIVRYKTLSERAYKKAGQMGLFQDILPGVTQLKLKDSEKRKKEKSNIIDNNKNDETKINNSVEDKL